MKTFPDTSAPLVITALAIGAGPHIPYLPAWVIVTCLLSWGYILAALRYRWPVPPRSFRIICTLAAFSGVIIMSGKSFNSDSGVALMTLMAGLKPLETTAYRDKMIAIFLAYFSVAAGLLLSSALEMSLYMIVAIILITGLLVRINHPEKKPGAAFRLSSAITFQAIPVMLILFFLFPRIHSGLWGIKQRETAATGFSDTLTPGSVTRLVKNNATAFRVTFAESIPAYNRRYWRGIVFQDFNGKHWKSSLAPRVFGMSGSGSDRTTYTVTLEPHNRRWLFALDIPETIPGKYRMREDSTLSSRWPVRDKRHYTVTSVLKYNTGEFRSWDKRSLLLPLQGNHKARELAESLFGQSQSTDDYIDKIFRFYRENNFTYTLNPPLLGDNPVDEFLFDNRLGYCEHYASSFVFLMRAAGIPARVVGGYLGGEVNPIGNYIIVRQSDAHAWTEVWIEKRGWVRVDPTSVVAPARMDSGISSALNEEEVPEFLTTPSKGLFFRLQQQAILTWDAATYQWHTTFVGYSSLAQRKLLKRLGLEIKNKASWLKVAGFIIFLITGISLILFLRINRQSSQLRDPVTKQYHHYCKKLESIGIKKLPEIGPVDFAKKASELRPDLSPEINGITRVYVLLKYGNQSGNTSLTNDLKSMVKRFRPGKSSPDPSGNS